MKLSIPELCLVVLIGPSGAGKSTFARKHFLATEVISSDECRGLVADDPNSQEATHDAFDVLKYIAGKRLERGRLTVVDATNVQEEARRPLVQLAREHDVLPVAVVLKLPEEICSQRNRARPDRDFERHVVRNQCIQLRRSLRHLGREGFRYVHVLSSIEDVEAASFERQPLWNNRKTDRGPFDIIGDVHGCFDELIELLTKLGYKVERQNSGTGFQPVADAPSSIAAPAVEQKEPHGLKTRATAYSITPPAGRKAIFLGDLVDRGPKSPEVLRLVMGMVAAGNALCVPGNHDVRLLKKLRGRDVQLTHGLAETLAQLEAETSDLKRDAADFIDKLISHYVLDDGKLVVAHAGMKERYIGRSSSRVRDFSLYGETTGESDDLGLPIRLDWASEYRGDAAIVYGHTPVPEPRWHNNTINIDTGCVFGGKLTALLWPEKQTVSVSAHQTYCQPARPFLPPPVMGEPREFGERVPDVTYHSRPGCYAIIADQRVRIAVMKLGRGYFLPGGGAEPGETPTQTLERELREECARGVQIIRPLGVATQLINTSDRHLAKIGTYFEAAFTDALDCQVEADHELLWLDPPDAIKHLKHEAQRFAVQAWMESKHSGAAQTHDDVLDISDVLGKRIIQTRLGPGVTIREENGIAALEVMSRFAADPRWLIYLPPTMSPSETSTEPGLLEHPAQAFEYFRRNGVASVVCEEKHMGSRAVAIVCRDQRAAGARFGVEEPGIGIIYTRTGRRFFEDRALESQLLEHVHHALQKADFFSEFHSDWFCLDCELMPWSAKAQELLQKQYAAVGSAANAALAEVNQTLAQAMQHHRDDAGLAALLERHEARAADAAKFVQAYRHYCWRVQSVADLKLAPFHLLASEGNVHADRDHLWHMQTLAKLAADDSSLLIATEHRAVDLNDATSTFAAVAWWEELTAAGGEGMVVKPLSFIARGPRGILQPAVKCRGREYLRIIYGPDYTLPENLQRLRNRGLGAKRSLALREFALGMESLERFVAREPLHRVHECVFGVLALESEPVDPRL